MYVYMCIYRHTCMCIYIYIYIYIYCSTHHGAMVKSSYCQQWKINRSSIKKVMTAVIN